MTSFQTINPATEVVINTYQELSIDEMNSVIDKIHHDYLQWRTISFSERAEKMHKVAQILTDKKEEIFYISSGMLEVQPYVVTVLADTALRARDIDEAAALQAKERAERMLEDKVSEVDIAKASAELAEAVAQIQAVRKLKKQAKQ